MELLLFLAGMAIAILLLMFGFPLIPGVINALTNKPNRFQGEDWRESGTTPNYKKSEFGFFTYLQPGRVKIIERGNRFIRALMRYPGYMFQGERSDNDLTPRHEEYWRRIVTETGYEDSHPIPFPGDRNASLLWALYSPISILFWVWKRWVYFITGAVFTGIYPFQKVRTYPIEHFKTIKQPDGSVDLERIIDYSDHYRVADFQYPTLVPEADTKDKIPVKVLINLIARVDNPFLVAYNTDDDWGTRTLASISDAVVAFTRPRMLDEVLSSSEESDVHKITSYLQEEIQKAVQEYGLKVRRVQVLDISPTDRAISARLGDLAIARVDRSAREERAIGEAAPIRESGKALKEYPDAAHIAQIEGTVRAADAASKGNGIVILGGTQQSTDPLQAAILQELRKLNGQGGGQTPRTDT